MKWYKIEIWKTLMAIPILMFALLLFGGCKSKQSVVTQHTYITDKENDKKWDSLFNMRLTKELERFQYSHSEKVEKTLKDITHIKDSTASRFDASGKKIGEDKYHSEVRIISEKDVQKLKDSIEYYKEYVDSAKIYHSKADSLRKELLNISKDKIFVEKGLSKWQKICLQTGLIFYIFLLVTVFVIIYNIFKKKNS